MSKKDGNPKDRAVASKLDLSLVPDSATVALALAFTEGDLKYGGYNWRTCGAKASVYVAACRRHLMKWVNGEEGDPETGVPHLASAMACLAVLFDSQALDVLQDDRPPRGHEAALLAIAETLVAQLQARYPSPPDRYTRGD